MQFTSFPVGCGNDDLFLDRIEVDPCGIIRVIGWSSFSEIKQCPRVFLDSHIVPFLQHYRVTRPDVDARVGVTSSLQTGLVFEFLGSESLAGRQFEALSIQIDGFPQFRFQGAFEFLSPHYRGFLTSSWVRHRETVYLSGPPNMDVHPDILALAKKLEGPVLDFGCGSGAVVAELQKLGREARGLELDTPLIRDAISPQLAGSVTLYDGRFPSSFSTASFKSVFCSEVLEHIPDFRSAVREIARLATHQVIFTVPDIAAIPIGFRHGLAPWHLLESTHVNFFNQKSLESLLLGYFAKIDFGRVCPCNFNDSPFHVSLVASCFK
ncbi:MAG: class I SAM-dependent methyltransferase [Acidobacteriaceae bacterium]|nr:class I SAM-dependent methyltransferase [Acidobacteriaceae bacterium]MBV9296802.1 class I SAM-dependent methyltransferase [Acidobacteriaceae bacterium]MBV9765734.1 class I SAM-dependent methyltransferase [Acidobacteriaceae bacterium]